MGDVTRELLLVIHSFPTQTSTRSYNGFAVWHRERKGRAMDVYSIGLHPWAGLRIYYDHAMIFT